MCKRLVRFVPKINTLKPRPGPAPGRRLGECGRHRPQDVTGDGSDEWREDLSDRLEEVRDPKMKIFAVNVHPVWGGWYAYRALVVLRNGRQALEQQKPLDFLSNEEKKKSLSEYNLRHQLCLWRDLSETHPPDRRYSPDEFFFFTETSPEKRRRFLDMKVSYMTAIPARRTQIHRGSSRPVCGIGQKNEETGEWESTFWKMLEESKCDDWSFQGHTI
eukprot:g30829.t1